MSLLPFKVSPSSYTFEVIKDGLIKTGVAANGYDSFEYIGINAKKYTKTETWVGDIAFWDSKIQEIYDQNLLITNYYVLTGVSVDGNYTLFLGESLAAQGSLTFTKYKKTGGIYTPPPPVENSNLNLEILQYTVDGDPIVTNYKGITETKNYWVKKPLAGGYSLPIAGTKESETVLLQSVSISGQKVINDELYINITETRIKY